jgi:hypothetical protein
MYLTAEIYVSPYDFSDGDMRHNELFDAIHNALPNNYPVSEDAGGFYVGIPVAYWRKFNALHGLIVDNYADGVDNCQQITLTRKNIADIKETLETAINFPEDAKMFLPPKAGFFFGSQECDEWYWDKVKETVKVLTELLKSPYEVFKYEASW